VGVRCSREIVNFEGPSIRGAALTILSPPLVVAFALAGFRIDIDLRKEAIGKTGRQSVYWLIIWPSQREMQKRFKSRFRRHVSQQLYARS